MAMQMMKGIVVILVINHYLANLSPYGFACLKCSHCVRPCSTCRLSREAYPSDG